MSEMKKFHAKHVQIYERKFKCYCVTGTLSHEGSHVANETTRVMNKSNG